MICCHPHLSCSTDCTCPCDECAEEQRVGEAAAIEMHRRERLDLFDAQVPW